MRIIVKVGTRVLCRQDGIGLDEASIFDLAQALAMLARDHEVLLVSSGAVGAGLFETGRSERPADTPTLQALAAVGQCRLMHAYRQAFSIRSTVAAQLLLTYADLDTDERRRRVLQTIEATWALGRAVPVVNENDSVAVDELRFGDNDLLSARVATTLRADLLVLLTSVDGLFRPAAGGRRELVAEVDDLDAVLGWAEDHRDPLSRGGMGSKLAAVRHAVDAGIPTVIAHGRHPGRLASIVGGTEVPCTRFRVAGRG